MPPHADHIRPAQVFRRIDVPHVVLICGIIRHRAKHIPHKPNPVIRFDPQRVRGISVVVPVDVYRDIVVRDTLKIAVEVHPRRAGLLPNDHPCPVVGPRIGDRPALRCGGDGEGTHDKTIPWCGRRRACRRRGVRRCRRGRRCHRRRIRWRISRRRSGCRGRRRCISGCNFNIRIVCCRSCIARRNLNKFLIAR